MSIPVYTPTNKIVHTISVDFVRREIPPIIHVVQMDKYLPIIEVKLYKNGEQFTITDLEPSEINIRCSKPDHTETTTSILGVNSAGTSLYFEITDTMTEAYGKAIAVIEVKIDQESANSSPFYIDIDRNPVERSVE